MAGLGSGADGVWTIDGGAGAAWTRFAGRGSDPGGAAGGALWTDAASNRAYWSGGALASGGADWSTLWSLPLDGDAATRFYWSAAATSGSIPGGAYAAWAYDTRRRALLVFGGDFPGAAGPDSRLFRLDVATRTWSVVATTGAAPSARADARAVYDSLTDRCYMYGGVGPTTDGAELWALAPGASPHWTAVPEAYTPANPYPSQSGMSLALDSRRGRLVTFGGANPVTADAWVLDPAAATPTWTLLSPAGVPPSGRGYASLVYDPIADRLVTFSGLNGLPGGVADTWALSLSGSTAWSQLQPANGPPGRSFHSADYDAAHDRMLVYGDYYATDHDLRVLQWERARTLPVPVVPPSAGLRLTVLENPATMSVSIALALGEAGEVSLDLLDLAGRRVYSQRWSALAAGSNVLAFTPGVRAGLYWARVRQGSREAKAKVVLLR
jgi:hypothetical protein